MMASTPRHQLPDSVVIILWLFAIMIVLAIISYSSIIYQNRAADAKSHKVTNYRSAADGTEVIQAEDHVRQGRIIDGATPLDRSMTLTDSQGCAWEVSEDQSFLKLKRYMKPDGTPVCASTPMTNDTSD